ncbi:MAG: outer membrane protein assembly factor BamB [Steroidobacteraceae bacterium]
MSRVLPVVATLPAPGRRWAAGLAVAVLTLLAACSKEKDVEPPAELVDFKPTLRVDRAWSAKLAGGDAVLRLGLAASADGERLYAAGAGGEIAAFDLANGRVAWRIRTKAALSGGTGSGHGLVVVGSADGEVIALEQADGRERWRVPVGGELLAAPAISATVVVVRTVDGRLLGLDPATGKERWREEQQVPRLTLRGIGTPAIVGNVALSGFDNGRVLAVNVDDGEIIWDAVVTPPRGRTELERLVDIDAAVKVSGADVFVVGYQGRAAMLALDSGQVWWSREISSHRGLDFDDDAVYVSTAGGEVVALRRRTGVELWRQDAFLRRGLSAPTVVGDYVAIADFQGYVHWLERTSGTLVARTRVGDRVSNAPVAVGDTLYVLDDKGGLAAFRTRPAVPTAAEAAPPAAAVAPAAAGEAARRG